MGELDMNKVAAEWIRAVRGKRSQSIVSRELGYQSNILYRWEAGICFPPASTALRLAQQAGIDTTAAIRRFLPGPSEWMNSVAVSSAAGIVHLLAELRGRIPIVELASALGVSRFTLSRWLSGRSEPSLPELFRIVDKASLRLLDFIAAFVSPQTMPSVRKSWHQLVQSRQAAYDFPWSHAVLRLLELRVYRDLPAHQLGWIAKRLNISEQMASLCIDLLERAGQVTWTGTHYVPNRTSFVDTRYDHERSRMLKIWWTQVGLERLKEGAPGLFAYNLCSLSRDDLERLESLQRKYYRQMVQIIEQSTGSDFVVLYGAQLLRLDSERE